MSCSWKYKRSVPLWSRSLVPVEDVEMWRITRVYDRTHPRDARKLEIGDRQLVWEGKPVVELTLEEIADRLFIPVEQLRIKDKK